MSIDQLPNEILENIFRKMYGSVVVRCRAVCRRWRDAVDGLPDAHWKRICLNDYLREDYETAHRKYGMSWRDVYKAVNSWRNIRSVNMDWHHIGESIQHFKVLPHNIIALLKNDRNKMYHQYSDTIVYYNLETSQVCGREEFDFVFSPRFFDENEHFIVLIRYEGTLVIVLKVNKTQYLVGNLLKYGHFGQDFTKMTIIDKEIYFQDMDDVIYVSKIVQKDDKTIVHTQPIEYFIKRPKPFAECVVAFSKKNGKLHVLTDEENIYVLNDSDMGCALKIEQYCWDLFHDLRCCGFDWRSHDVFEWLFGMTEPLPLKKCYLHGNIILVAQNMTLKIFLTGLIMGKEELKSIVKGGAKRRVDMKKIFKSNEAFTTVQQLDIVETQTEHKVLVLAQRQLCVFEFQHCYEKMVLRSMTKRKPIEKPNPPQNVEVPIKRKAVKRTSRRKT